MVLTVVVGVVVSSPTSSLVIRSSWVVFTVTVGESVLVTGVVPVVVSRVVVAVFVVFVVVVTVGSVTPKAQCVLVVGETVDTGVDIRYPLVKMRHQQ